jgi:hypothetical protein
VRERVCYLPADEAEGKGQLLVKRT